MKNRIQETTQVYVISRSSSSASHLTTAGNQADAVLEPWAITKNHILALIVCSEAVVHVHGSHLAALLGIAILALHVVPLQLEKKAAALVRVHALQALRHQLASIEQARQICRRAAAVERAGLEINDMNVAKRREKA